MQIWEPEALAYGGTQDPVSHGQSKTEMNQMPDKYHMIRFNLE